ncbi:MAG: ABC transporter ATP-binding protein [Myxococcaceae bacterium]|jgi:lipopolysaccharide transport system ATP-binding protein|nr:ABC transporter ATP-binding protein [Myxococcaceae bacterium]MCA3013191.1 ABC transporter ATP-binding protein [Myxococcaceae bacterium]
MSGLDAIVLERVSKHFKKRSKRNEMTTLKSEVVRILKGQRKVVEPAQHIEALKGVDLRVPRGATMGIVGRNGSGKSTLLKLVTGIYAPTSGTVAVNGRISALLELGAGFHPDFTGRENILINGIILGMSRAEVKERVAEIVDFAELGDFIDEPVRTYSSGMFMRLAFSVATHVDPDILIIDEILSVGDEHFQRKSSAKMNEFRQSGKTILFVTHDLSRIETWCDSAVWIDGGRTRMVGDPRQVVTAYRQAVSAAEAEGERLGHSALSTPGLALPQVSAPPVEAVAPAVQLVDVRLRDGLGAHPSAFSAEGALEVLVDVQLAAAARCDVSVEVATVAGVSLFKTQFAAGELGGGAHTLRLSLPRLGLGEGAHVVTATAWSGALPPQAQSKTLVVAPHPSAFGLLRPEHAWSLEPRGDIAPAPAPRAPEATA